MAAALATVTAALGAANAASTTLGERGIVDRRFNSQIIESKHCNNGVIAKRAGLQSRRWSRSSLGLGFVGKQTGTCRAGAVASVSELADESVAVLADGDGGDGFDLFPSDLFEASIEVVDGGSESAGVSASSVLEELTKSAPPSFELPLLDNVKESFSSSLEAAQTTLESVQEAAQSTLEGVVPSLDEGGESVSESLTTLQSTVGGALDSAQNKLEDAADAAKESLSNLVDSFKLPSFDVVKQVAPALEAPPPAEELRLEGASEGVTGLEGRIEEAVESVVQAVSPATGVAEDATVAAPVESTKSAVESLLDSSDILSFQEAQEGLKGSVKSASESAEAAKEAVSGALNAASESVSDSVTGALQSTTSVFSNAADSVNNVISSAVNSVVDSVNGAVSSVENAYLSVVESAKSSVSNTVGSVQSKVSGAAESVTKPIVGANRELLEGVVKSGKEVAGMALSAVGKVAGEGYSALREALPAEYQTQLDVVEEKVVLVAEPTGKVLGQAAEAFVALERKLGVDPDDPAVTVAIFLAGSTFLGVAYWQATYGGYSGDLAPQEAMQLLKTDNSAVLIDIRPQELRDQEGVPDLRRGARFRTAAVEPTRMQGTIRGQVKNADDVDNLITAALILGLKQVSSSSKVVVMDRDGSKSKEIARALGKLGLRRRYRMEGGFKGWAAAGLRVRDDVPVSPLEILKEETEDLVEEVKPTPLGVAAVLLGIAAGVYAIIEYERTLQLIGVVGLGTSVYLRAQSYQTADDLKNDLRVLQKPFALGAAGLAWGLSLIEPSARPALATSSNSVQEYGGASSPDEPVEETEEIVVPEKEVAPPVAAAPVAITSDESQPQVEAPSATNSS